jgi:hypothetical protein
LGFSLILKDIFTPRNVANSQRKANPWQRGCANFSLKKVKNNSFFMKGHLLHNIHNNDNKIESKINNQEIHFITNLGQKESFKPCLLSFFFCYQMMMSFWVSFSKCFHFELNLTFL